METTASSLKRGKIAVKGSRWWLARSGFLALFLGTTVAGGESPSGPKMWSLPPWAFFREQLPPPPPEGSPKHRDDLAAVAAEQSQASPAEQAEAIETYKLSVFSFSKVLGPGFSAARFPVTAAFFSTVDVRVNEIVLALKQHYARPHPDKAQGVGTGIKRLVAPPSDANAYPSGHSTRAMVYALTLAQIDSARAVPLKEWAHKIARYRVVTGQHYPSDVSAGLLLGTLLWESLWRDSAFRVEINELTKSPEWRALKAKP